MTERFSRVFSLTPNLYSVGCPIIIEAGALQKDTETGDVLAQIKMKNIGDRDITSCKVSLRAYENNGHELEGVKGFSYLDLNVVPGDEFGSKTPVFLTESTARSFSISIDEIVYVDNSIDSTIYSEWKSIPQQEEVSSILKSEELTKQYKIEVGTFANYVPQIADGLFQCTCGSTNLNTNKKCYKCGSTYEHLAEHLFNPEKLSEKAKERQAKEGERKAFEESKKKKTIKLITIGAIIAAIVIVGIISVVSYNNSKTLPFKVGDSYSKAERCFKSNDEDYDQSYSERHNRKTLDGSFDYFGIGEECYQGLTVCTADYGDATEVDSIDVYLDWEDYNKNADEYNTVIIEKLYRTYDVDVDSVKQISSHEITMKGDGVMITLEENLEDEDEMFWHLDIDVQKT